MSICFLILYNCFSIARVVKESGGTVPEYMLSIKKPSKREKKDLEKYAPVREPIDTTPIYEQIRERRKENAIKRTKRKIKLALSTNKASK